MDVVGGWDWETDGGGADLVQTRREASTRRAQENLQNLPVRPVTRLAFASDLLVSVCHQPSPYLFLPPPFLLPFLAGYRWTDKGLHACNTSLPMASPHGRAASGKDTR